VKICFVNEYFPPFAPGGAEWSLDALARALAHRGHRVVVVTPNWGAEPQEDHHGFSIVRVPFPKTLPRGRRPASPKWLANPLTYLYMAFQVARVARRERADVIHAHNKHSLIPCVIAGWVTRIPVCSSIRDGSIIDATPMCLHYGDRRPADCGVRKLWRECSEDFFQRYVRNPRRRLRTKLGFLYYWWDSLLKQWFLRKVNAVIGVSDGILGIYQRSGLFDGVGRVRRIYSLPPMPAPPSSADIAALRDRIGVDGARVVLSVGKFSEGKGTPDIEKAIDGVVAQVPETLFLFVGAGARPMAGEHVKVLDELPNAEVQALYPIADVVLVPSVIPDALSRVILEAMAAGRPVVATKVGGSPELVIDGVTGFLVDRHAPDQLARAIVKILRDPGLRDALGAAAQRHVAERFSAGDSIEKLLAVYAEIGAGSAPARPR
jgi:glycosyltransferase involved in cell wall biosynthesis